MRDVEISRGKLNAAQVKHKARLERARDQKEFGHSDKGHGSGQRGRDAIVDAHVDADEEREAGHEQWTISARNRASVDPGTLASARNREHLSGTLRRGDIGRSLEPNPNTDISTLAIKNPDAAARELLRRRLDCDD